MSSDTSTTAGETIDTQYIRDNLREQRREILLLFKADPTRRLTSRDARQEGIKSSKYHLDQLRQWGLLEITGTESVGKGADADVFETTEFGREFIDSFLRDDRELDVGELDTHVDELRSRVDELERRSRGYAEVETVEDELAQVRQELDGFEQQNKELKTAMSAMIAEFGKIDADAKQRISDAIQAASENKDES